MPPPSAMPSSHLPDQVIFSAGSGAASQILQPVLGSATQPLGASREGGGVAAGWANAVPIMRGPASTAIAATIGTYNCITNPLGRRKMPHDRQHPAGIIGSLGSSPGRTAGLD